MADHRADAFSIVLSGFKIPKSVLFYCVCVMEATPQPLWTLAAMNLFSRKQHSELLRFLDLFESVPSCDRHWCPIFSLEGLTRYGDDLMLGRCNPAPFESPNDFVFYARIRYNGKEYTSFIQNTAGSSDFLYLPMNNALDSLKLWKSLKDFQNKMIYQSEAKGPFPVGQSATVVCVDKVYQQRPSLTAIGCNTYELCDRIEYPPDDDRKHVIEKLSEAPTMIVWLDHVEVLDEDSYAQLGFATSDSDILGMCIRWLRF